MGARRALRGGADREPAGDALIATGHTASDQVETILYRLAASPGRRALLGMVAAEGRLIRPLLGVTREQTAAYCEARGLQWREDESNDEQYARARVRHGLVPALRAVHPGGRGQRAADGVAAARGDRAARRLVEEELAGRHSIAIARLRCRRRWRAWWSCAWPRTPPAPTSPRRAIASRRSSRSAGRGGRAELHVGGQAGAVIEDGVLRMVKLPPRA